MNLKAERSDIHDEEIGGRPSVVTDKTTRKLKKLCVIGIHDCFIIDDLHEHCRP